MPCRCVLACHRTHPLVKWHGVAHPNVEGHSLQSAILSTLLPNRNDSKAMKVAC